MILENNYSHASDVWAFGILAWELYTAFATGQEAEEGRPYSVPYYNLVADEVCVKAFIFQQKIGYREHIPFRHRFPSDVNFVIIKLKVGTG